MFQQPQRGDADAGVELVDVAGNEEADSHPHTIGERKGRGESLSRERLGSGTRGRPLFLLLDLRRLASLFLLSGSAAPRLAFEFAGMVPLFRFVFEATHGGTRRETGVGGNEAVVLTAQTTSGDSGVPLPL